MSTVRGYVGALVGAALVATAAQASAAPRSALAVHAEACRTNVAFGEAVARDNGLFFRGTVVVTCPAGIPFTLALSSAHGCTFERDAGVRFRYAVYADPALRIPLIACEGAPEPLRGVGGQTFVVFGRADAPITGSGRFSDALVATLTL